MLVYVSLGSVLAKSIADTGYKSPASDNLRQIYYIFVTIYTKQVSINLRKSTR